MKNYLDKPSRQKENTKSKKNGNKLTNSGRVFKNGLLDVDMTTQQVIRRNLK